MWKVGVIGAGFWSDKHLKAWSRIPNVEIAAMCDHDYEKLKRKAALYNVQESKLYRDAKEMLDRTDLDFVDIITGPDTHLELVSLVSSYGKHILCQKPFARSLEEAKTMIEIAHKANVRLMVTENWRWLTPYQIVKKVLDEGRLGTLQVARFASSTFFTPRLAPDRKILQRFLVDMPRLMFFETGVHWLDMWRFLFGEPKRLYAESMRFSPYVKGEDSGVVTLGYDHFYGIMDLSWATRREFWECMKDNSQINGDHVEHFIIDGDKATLKMYGFGTIAIIDNNGMESVIAQHTEIDYEESHFRLQSHFIECLDTGKPFQTSGEDNLQTLKLTFAVYESSQEHKPIFFD